VSPMTLWWCRRSRRRRPPVAARPSHSRPVDFGPAAWPGCRCLRGENSDFENLWSVQRRGLPSDLLRWVYSTLRTTCARFRKLLLSGYLAFERCLPCQNSCYEMGMRVTICNVALSTPSGTGYLLVAQNLTAAAGKRLEVANLSGGCACSLRAAGTGWVRESPQGDLRHCGQ
jgi:hypothetical protein